MPVCLESTDLLPTCSYVLNNEFGRFEQGSRVAREAKIARRDQLWFSESGVSWETRARTSSSGDDGGGADGGGGSGDEGGVRFGRTTWVGRVGDWHLISGRMTAAASGSIRRRWGQCAEGSDPLSTLSSPPPTLPPPGHHRKCEVETGRRGPFRRL
uniref:Uncharacterized protein n=1 Tax=Vespula pensylvanica TaxID=30213 RepID=A0A834UA50_VESPE|nr:hypothetical protein H0235_007759 [Vespula pensylvanica]